MSSTFVDHVRLYLKSGKGGDGMVSWRREKYVQKGGPDGGDGGKGGDVIIRANSQLWTLLDLKYRKFINAEDGNKGEGGLRTGRSGKNVILEVPLGTVIIDDETEEILGEVTKEGEELMVLEGGHGGKGNWAFRSSTQQAPDFALPGGQAREMTVVLELKVLADVGLVGFPNAGKSTLLSVVSEAKPKIADYAFTTLVPNLGIVRYKGYQSFVMADIPGIIEGAHLGKGLGIQFLRHIERNSILLFLIPVESEDIRKEYEILLHEVEAYNEELIRKPRILALTKSDIIDEQMEREMYQSIADLHPLFISSITGKGIEQLKEKLWNTLTEINADWEV